MKFDNGTALYRIMKKELITTLVFAAVFSISFLDIYKTPFLPLEGYQFAILITLFFLLVAFFWYGKNYSYFSFDNTGENIIIKYFRITPKIFQTKPKMIRIPKSSFAKYTIKTSFMGARKALFLFQKTKQGIVKYPPIYITALSPDEIKKLESALQY